MKREQFMEGLRRAAPICLGVVPIGISFGIMSLEAGLQAWECILMSVMVMAGSSQIMAVGMIGQGVGALPIVLATFFVNLRHVVMSTAVMNRLRETPLGHKLVGAFALCDESFAVFSLAPEPSFPLLMGADLGMYAAWIASTAAGCFAHSLLPDIVSRSFGVAIYAAFIGMLLPNVKGSIRLLLLVGLTALLHVLLRLLLPASWALILAMVLAAAAGVFFVEDEAEAKEAQEA